MSLVANHYEYILLLKKKKKKTLAGTGSLAASVEPFLGWSFVSE